MPGRLEGRVALVTGGNTGIGEAISTRLASEGVHVGIGYFEDPARAESLAATAGADRCVAVPCDVTDERSVASALDAIEERLRTGHDVGEQRRGPRALAVPRPRR